jgi:hypothetical protein
MLSPLSSTFRFYQKNLFIYLNIITSWTETWRQSTTSQNWQPSKIRSSFQRRRGYIFAFSPQRIPWKNMGSCCWLYCCDRCVSSFHVFLVTNDFLSPHLSASVFKKLANMFLISMFCWE